MTDQTDSWDDIDWTKVEADVFHMQRRIYSLSKQNRRKSQISLQKLLITSKVARLLSVRRAAEDSKGSGTPGVDREKDLTPVQKSQLAEWLNLFIRPHPVKRVFIPKPGTFELRPLGIPTIRDRALQHLMVLTLEPQWEAKLSPHQYGFRRGRSAHDALFHIKGHIMRSPKWVLDADVEKFFDRIDHAVILQKIDTWPAMRTAIRRILKSGTIDGVEFTPSEAGTPQGGPLSPLLANIALAGLEEALEEDALTHKAKPPRTVIYADDLVVLHEDRARVEAAATVIDRWLRPMGLNLNARKTRIVHTLESTDGQQAGFDFLGCRIQQFRTGKYALKPWFKGIWTNVRPSRKAVKGLRAKIKGTVKQYGPKKRRNAAYAHRIQSGKAGPIEVMIIQLNRVLRGWSNYHRHGNAKRTFSAVDSWTHDTLWHWACRNFKRKSRYAIVAELFNGGNPWKFSTLGADGERVELMKADSTPIRRYFPVDPNKSFYDGDGVYWGTRRGEYPGIPGPIATLLKRQRGFCASCRQRIGRGDHLTIEAVAGGKPSRLLHHSDCDRSNDGLRKGASRNGVVQP